MVRIGALWWWMAEFLLVGVSVVVFAILDLGDRLLCVVFGALDSILDSETTPCYCKLRIRGALPQTLGPSLLSPQNVLGRPVDDDDCGGTGDTPSYNANTDCSSHALLFHAIEDSLSHGIEDSLSPSLHHPGHPSDHGHSEPSFAPQNDDKFVEDTPSFHAVCALAVCPSQIKDSPSQPKHSEGHLPSHAYDTGECKTLMSCDWECKSFVKLPCGNDGCPSDTKHVHHGRPSRAKQGHPSHSKAVLGGNGDSLLYAHNVHSDGDHPSHGKQVRGSEDHPPPLAKEVNGRQKFLSPTHAGKSNSKFLRPMLSRWSDCGCSTCTSWQSDGMELLYVHVEGKGHENVVFIHGFLSSSAIWSEKVIPHLPCESRASHRLFAVDLLGFGKSPKPRSCLYTMADHIKKIEESVLHRYKIDSFHLVAHSMGCIVALALAAAHVDSIKTITLVAPPYFPAPENESGASYVLRQLAPRRIWPPLAFGASVMSWYEHVGRGLCFLLCKQHFMWEWVLSILTLNRISRFAVRDFMQHTHHSAWHIFHNVICGEAHAMDGYLSILEKGSCKIHVIHGKDDSVVPVQCSYELQKQFQNLELEVLDGRNHFTVIYGQEELLALKFQKIWRKETSNTISHRKL